ncbi:hypothetical protein Hdeb2414_s0001g00035511 [Helianthus debilis subsp. tardiflorus]
MSADTNTVPPPPTRFFSGETTGRTVAGILPSRTPLLLASAQPKTPAPPRVPPMTRERSSDDSRERRRRCGGGDGGEAALTAAVVDRNDGWQLDSDSNTLSVSSADMWFLFRVVTRGSNLIRFWFEYFKWALGFLGCSSRLNSGLGLVEMRIRLHISLFL